MASLHACALVMLAAVGCHSRTLTGQPTGVLTGERNFGFFPSFAATIPRDGARYKPQPMYLRRKRSAGHADPASADGGKAETDAVDLDDFIARHGGFSDDRDDAPSTHNNRLKRADEEGNAENKLDDNNLSWLLEQDAWEKVDDDLDWDNIGKEEFDAREEPSPPRGARDAADASEEGGGESDSLISEDAIYQRIQKLAKDLEERRKEMYLLSRIEDPSGGSGEGATGEGATGEGATEKPANPSGDEEESQSHEDYGVEDDYLEESVRRRRRRSADNDVVEVEGRIDMAFESAPEKPSATVIIEKDPLPPNPPAIPPPIYFCGTKTDPDNPDSVSGEVSETVGAH